MLVQKPHAIRDTVEGKGASCKVQVDANTQRDCCRNVCALVAVYEGEFGVGAVQTPGVAVPAQTAFVAITLAADPLVGDGNVYFSSSPVHLPVTASPSHAVPAQHLEHNGQRETFQTQNAAPVAVHSKLGTRAFR